MVSREGGEGGREERRCEWKRFLVGGANGGKEGWREGGKEGSGVPIRLAVQIKRTLDTSTGTSR